MKPNNIKIIGLTGGIATGKSTVSEILKKNGYTVIDADIIAREVVNIDKPSYEEIKKYFGNEILLENKEIDRKKLGSIVFNDIDKLLVLNELTHPYIYEEILKQVNINKGKNIFIDIPLLFEEEDKIKKSGIEFDEIWLVASDYDIQVQRLMKRDKISKEEAVKKIKLQMNLKEKIDKSDLVI
ncbi:MAG TPA: dephospho-CoA kinase [Tissierellaceae bacterium]